MLSRTQHGELQQRRILCTLDHDLRGPTAEHTHGASSIECHVREHADLTTPA